MGKAAQNPSVSCTQVVNGEIFRFLSKSVWPRELIKINDYIMIFFGGLNFIFTIIITLIFESPRFSWLELFR